MEILDDVSGEASGGENRGYVFDNSRGLRGGFENNGIACKEGGDNRINED